MVLRWARVRPSSSDPQRQLHSIDGCGRRVEYFKYDLTITNPNASSLTGIAVSVTFHRVSLEEALGPSLALAAEAPLPPASISTLLR